MAEDRLQAADKRAQTTDVRAFEAATGSTAMKQRASVMALSVRETREQADFRPLRVQSITLPHCRDQARVEMHAGV